VAISLRLAAPPTDGEIRGLSASNPGYRFERTAGGELVVTPTGGRSGRAEAELIAQLVVWAKADGMGVVFSSATGFQLPDGALLAPDASWIRRDRWDALTRQEQEDFVPLCPDATFEVASPSDRLPDLRRKCRAYVANGARLAVLIDPQQRTVEVYLPGGKVQTHGSPRSVSCDPVLGGFVMVLGPIFGETTEA
jgi:Uma2 family endonuclease